MPSFRNGDVEIAYLDEGEGEPILLVHGFASNKEVNWVIPGWVSTLKSDGRRVIAFDHRGHGQSTKLYDVAAYGVDKMALDAVALLDHLNIGRADVLGYSMGGRVTGQLASAHGGRVRSAVIGGIGIRLCEAGFNSEKIAEALEAPNADGIADAHARGFRMFALQTKSDMRALAACMRNNNRTISREAAASIRLPVLVATGTEDTIAGSGDELGALIPGSKVLNIPGRDHMFAVGDRVFKEGVLAFLKQRP
jgi:pimeloyl-ACP methyl ester carboxylesterase